MATKKKKENKQAAYVPLQPKRQTPGRNISRQFAPLVDTTQAQPPATIHKNQAPTVLDTQVVGSFRRPLSPPTVSSLT